MSSFAFLIGAVIVTVVANLIVLRFMLTRPLDPTFED